MSQERFSPDSQAVSEEANKSDGYALVHLVAQETLTNLIASQVVDHMAVQSSTNGRDRPVPVVVGFLEPVRHAIGSGVRTRVRELRLRAPGVPMAVLPYISRLSREANAPLVARALRRMVGQRRVVFHCRTEIAAEWAIALRSHFPGSGIVADIRGALAEEILYARGFDGPATADPRGHREYHEHLSRLHGALAGTGRVISVSPGMLNWLEGLGVDRRRLLYVPCCVAAVTYAPARRAAARAKLGLQDKLVFAYLGTITRYQHIEDGVLPFFRAAKSACENAHLLCLTNEPDRMLQLADAAGVPRTAITAMSVPQGQVADYLSASDCGLLLRAPAPINRLWQPTKLGEYLAAGVPMIVSRGVGRVDELVEEFGAGIAIDCFGVSADSLAAEARRVCIALAEQGPAMRERAVALCTDQFLWSSYVAPVREAYLGALSWRDPVQ